MLIDTGLIDAGLVVLGYLTGSIASAIIVARLMGLPDPRSIGSGNPGATNVLRTGSKGAAIVTLLGDILKGTLPVLLARFVTDDPLIITLTGLAAFLGHLFPLYFGFKGGKGVATLLGVLLGLNWMLGLAVAGTWLAVALLFRYSSLAALLAAALAPFYSYGLQQDLRQTLIVGLMCITLIARHHANIRNLLSGSEDRIGSKN